MPHTSSINNTPDIHSSSLEYSTRFSGALGTWLLKVQEEATFNLITKHLHQPEPKNIKICDIGGGHAQITMPLIKAGYLNIDVYGSSVNAFEKLDQEVSNNSDSEKIKKLIGSFENFAISDKTYDLVTCFRIISHINDPKNLIKELCRISNQAVVIDYATIHSVNFLSYIMFPLKKLVEKNTRYFHLFTTNEIKKEFEKNGFKVVEEVGQFLFPMALHRMLKNVKFSSVLESIVGKLGINGIFGSPKVLIAIRKF